MWMKQRSPKQFLFNFHLKCQTKVKTFVCCKWSDEMDGLRNCIYLDAIDFNSVSLPQTISMAGANRIKLFKFIQKANREIGIHPSHSNQISRRINSKVWFIILCHADFFISSAANLVFEANSMIEYGIACYTCSTAVFSVATYLISFWQMENILKFIENCERFIEKSKCFTTTIISAVNEWKNGTI